MGTKNLLTLLLCFSIATVTAQQFNGSSNGSGIISRTGSIKIDSYSKRGFILGGNNSHVSPWGGQYYGLTKGNKNVMALDRYPNKDYHPILVSGFFGLGFNSEKGRVALLQNGIFTIGVDGDDLKALTNKSPNNFHKLYVSGGIKTEEMQVTSKVNWADYVFSKEYDLMPLNELESYIKKEHHLPNIPSAKQIKEEGINVSGMFAKQMEKIEELTLYLIEANKKITTLEQQVEQLTSKE